MKQTIDITIGATQAPQIELIATAPRGPRGLQGAPGVITPTTLHSGSVFIEVRNSDNTYAGNDDKGLSSPIVNHVLEGDAIDTFKQNNFIHCPVHTDKFSLYASYTASESNNSDFQAFLYLVLENGEGSVSERNIKTLTRSQENAQEQLDNYESANYSEQLTQAIDDQSVVNSAVDAISTANQQIYDSTQSIAYKALIDQIEAIEALLQGQDYTLDDLTGFITALEPDLMANHLDKDANQLDLDGYSSLIEGYTTDMDANDIRIAALTASINSDTAAVNLYLAMYGDLLVESWYADLNSGLETLHAYNNAGLVIDYPEELYNLQGSLSDANYALNQASSTDPEVLDPLQAQVNTAQGAYDEKLEEAVNVMKDLFIFTESTTQNLELNQTLAGNLFTATQNPALEMADLMEAIIATEALVQEPTNNLGFVTWNNNISAYNSVITGYNLIPGLQTQLAQDTAEKWALMGENASWAASLEEAQDAYDVLGETQQTLIETIGNQENIINTLPGMQTSLGEDINAYNSTYTTTIYNISGVAGVEPEYTNYTQTDLQGFETTKQANVQTLASYLNYNGNSYEDSDALLTAIGSHIIQLNALIDNIDILTDNARGMQKDAQAALRGAREDLDAYNLQLIGTFPFTGNSPINAPGFSDKTLQVDFEVLGLSEFTSKGARFLLGWKAQKPQQYRVSYTLTAN
jgi:hypothetical protein